MSTNAWKYEKWTGSETKNKERNISGKATGKKFRF